MICLFNFVAILYLQITPKTNLHLDVLFKLATSAFQVHVLLSEKEHLLIGPFMGHPDVFLYGRLRLLPVLTWNAQVVVSYRQLFRNKLTHIGLHFLLAFQVVIV